MEHINPYATPASDISNIESLEEKDIKVWSFSGRLGRIRYLAYLMALFFLIWFGGGVLAAMLIPTIAEQNQSLMRLVGLVVHAGNNVTLSRPTSLIGKAHERRTSRRS